MKNNVKVKDDTQSLQSCVTSSACLLEKLNKLFDKYHKKQMKINNNQDHDYYLFMGKANAIREVIDIIEKELEKDKKEQRCFITGDNVIIKENEPYYAITFSNPEMNIVSSVMKVIFTKCEGWYEEPYRCFSTLEKANSYIAEKGFSFLTA